MRDLPKFARFWMVCRKPTQPNVRTEPRARYHHLADAKAAARQLSRETGAPFLILETVGVIDPGDPDAQGNLL